MFEQVGRYQICNKLGEGAMAEVYRAHDPKMGRDLAIKILNERMSADEKFRERFQREARAAGILSHPAIVTMFDVGEVEDRLFIAMELLEGVPLDEYMRSGKKLSLPQILQIGIQLADALDYAHSKGIIHRDIKPSNVILDTEKNAIKIADFGIARIEDPDLPKHTQTTEVLGTPQYMSPEQVMGRKIDGRTDLFSTGVLLYQLLSGQKPFKAETLGTLLFRIATEEPIPLKDLAPGLPHQVLHIVDQCLKKDPDNRFRTGHDLAQALRVVEGQGSAPVEDVSFDATVKLNTQQIPPVKVSRGPWLLVGGLVLAGAAAGGVYLYSLTPAPVPDAAKAASASATTVTSPATDGALRSSAESAPVTQPLASGEQTDDQIMPLAPQTAPVTAPKITITEQSLQSREPKKSTAKEASGHDAGASRPAAAKTETKSAAAYRAPVRAENSGAAETPQRAPVNVASKAAAASAPAAAKSTATAKPGTKLTSAAQSGTGSSASKPVTAKAAMASESAPATADKSGKPKSEPAREAGAEASRFPDFQSKLKYPTISKAKAAYRAKKISKKEYVDSIREIQQAERNEIIELKKLYKADKITKTEYKEKIREAKNKYD